MFSYIYIKEYELTAFWSVSRFLKQWNPLRKKELKDGEHVAFVDRPAVEKQQGIYHHMMETQMQATDGTCRINSEHNIRFWHNRRKSGILYS